MACFEVVPFFPERFCVNPSKHRCFTSRNSPVGLCDLPLCKQCKKWPIKHSITCEDSNVVYSVTCSHKAGQCLRTPAQYVGKVGSTRPCRVRCTEHRGAVTHHFDTGVGEHFNLPGHDLADFNFLPFEKVRSRDPFEVEARESFWIEKYGVLGEGGMNRRSWGEFYNNILIILQQLKCEKMPYLGLFLKMFV